MTAVCRLLYIFVYNYAIVCTYVQLLQHLDSDCGQQIAVHVVCIVQLCVTYVQLLQHLDRDCGLQIAVHVCLSLCNCVYLMYSHCSIWTVTAVGRLMYMFVCHCAIECTLCTVTAASGQ